MNTVQASIHMESASSLFRVGDTALAWPEMLISMRRRVTSRAIRPGTMSAETRKLIQEDMTSRAVGR